MLNRDTLNAKRLHIHVIDNLYFVFCSFTKTLPKRTSYHINPSKVLAQKRVKQITNMLKLAKYAKYAKPAMAKAPEKGVASKYAKYAKSVTVKAPETGVSTIQLTAVYQGNTVEDESVSVTLTQGQSYTFPEKTEYMGSQHWGTWTSVRPIHIIRGTINGGGTVFEANPKEYCNEVVDNLEFNIHHEPHHLHLNK